MRIPFVLFTLSQSHFYMYAVVIMHFLVSLLSNISWTPYYITLLLISSDIFWYHTDVYYIVIHSKYLKCSARIYEASCDDEVVPFQLGL